MNRFIRTIGIFSIVVAWSGSAVAETIKECEVSGAAVIPGGVMFDGTFSDTGGIESIDWTHDTPDFSFVTTEVSDTLISDGIICRQNGRETGVVLSEGTGTYNGMPGYGYLIETEDNRGPPDFVTLV